MRIALFFSVIALAFTLSAQEKSSPPVESVVQDYCGEDPYVAVKAENPNHLFVPLDAQKDSYRRCREMVIFKAVDAHLADLKKENDRLRTSLRSICALPDDRQTVRAACAVLGAGKN
jgi:hypothetical protein